MSTLDHRNPHYRTGLEADVAAMQVLARQSWGRFQPLLTTAHWQALYNNLNNPATYLSLLAKGPCIVCETQGRLIGMAFFIPSGYPDDIYAADWCQIRFVTVHPDYGGQGIGRKLTDWCMEQARQNKEHTIALHTSEMMANARHIYESMGFVQVRELAPRLGKRYWLYTMAI
jgi:ribosomal protein S18 acetylase RimI-like enzyme